MMRHEPGEADSTSAFEGKKDTKYASMDYKVENAIKHGAVGVLVVTDPLNHILISPRGFPWPSLSKIIPKDALPIILKQPDKKKLPIVHVGKEVMEMVFGSVDSLKKLEAAIDKDMKPLSKEFPAIKVKLKTTLAETQIKSNNVVGLLPGTDKNLKNELLVVGAHYDHIGFKREHKDGEDYINNGADDNASGTSGVLAVAEAFSRMKVKPKRSVLFITFSGEEKGLFGSRQYVQSPLFPIDSTVAMINMDMIGRNHPDTLYLEGAALSPDLTEIVKAENKSIGFTLITKEELYFGGSDHASFYKKKVPFVFFFAGLHKDYHTVRDNPETIDAEKAARVARLAFKTSWIIANDNKRYKIIDKN
jgi:hypothetical protein